MRISLNWLKTYIDIECTPEDLAHQLTMLGLEIESVERPGAEITEVYIGQILSIDPHPDAEKLVVCKTDVGQAEPLQIVCGAKNMKAGDRVPTAVIGATLPGGFAIARRKMRGIESQGMMCSARELGLGEEHDGLLILPPDVPVGADAKALLGLDDVVFEIEVTPNRGDWASMIGVARELAALYKKPLTLPEFTINESGTPAADLSSVTIDAPDLCPRYLGRVLTNVEIKPSPQWLQKRLRAAGQRPINNVVDITNYVLLETGHPLHAFDYEFLGEHRIVVRRAAEGEVMATLDGETRKLAADMLVIADAEKAVALAGIMGGANSEVGESTRTVFLESAVFNPSSIRSTSRRLGLATESSQRFQRGADPAMAEFAINRATQLMQELAGATVAPGTIDAYPGAAAPRDVRLRYARSHRMLGSAVPAAEQRDYLVRLGFILQSEDTDSCTFRVPSWRHDVTREIDLIEEVARLYGFENIGVTLPRVRPTERIYAPEDAAARALRQFLAGLGLNEVYHWTFSSEDDVRRAGLDGDYLNMVPLQNPLSEKHAMMRGSLLPALLNMSAYNLNRGVSSVTAFEIGPVYRPNPQAVLPDQEMRLAIVLTGTRVAQHWSHKAEPVDFYDIKGYAEALADYYGLPVTFTETELGTFQNGQCATIDIGGVAAGRLGKVAAPVGKAFDIEHEVYLLELELDGLLRTAKPKPQFQAIPSFPASLRDMAVLVNADVPAGSLQEAARIAGGKLLQSIDIFDVYTGKQVPTGKKSVALGLRFQSPEHTLTDKEVQKAWDKIFRHLQNQQGAELR
jgi:phenylalanyl-tRNA synthetase beta chain